MEDIDKITWNNGIIHPSWENFNKELLDNISDLQLLLSVISSYYINWEELPSWRTSDFTVKFINNLYKKSKLNLKISSSKWYGNHLSYIRKHLNLYYETRNNWNLYENWEKSIKNIVLNVWKKLHKFSKFRDWLVSHGQWAKLSKKEKIRAFWNWDDEILHKNSNFIFPPSNYIEEILEILDSKLKNKDIWVYKKAAYIWSYIFLAHPFFDGNSRTSRMLMISYLDKNDKRFIKLYTFLATFMKELPSYDDFLEKDIYPLFDKIKDDVEIETIKTENFWFDTVIKKYPNIEKYEQIIEQASAKLEKRLINISKYIYNNMEDINKILELISFTTNRKWDEKIVSNCFLKNMFDILKKDWLWKLIEDKNELFILDDKFYKDNKIDPDIIKKIESKFLSILDNV